MTLEDRLATLERRNRRLTLGLMLVAIAAGVVVAAGMGAAKPVPQDIKARSFKLVDDDGKMRASLDLVRDGPVLGLYDDDGKMRVCLGLWKDNPVLGLSDNEGEVRASLDVTKDGPRLRLFNDEGKPCACLGLVKDDSFLALSDENGRMRSFGQ